MFSRRDDFFKSPEQKGLVLNQLMFGKLSVKVMQSWLAGKLRGHSLSMTDVGHYLYLHTTLPQFEL